MVPLAVDRASSEESLGTRCPHLFVPRAAPVGDDHARAAARARPGRRFHTAAWARHLDVRAPPVNSWRMRTLQLTNFQARQDCARRYRSGLADGLATVRCTPRRTIEHVLRVGAQDVAVVVSAMR